MEEKDLSTIQTSSGSKEDNGSHAKLISPEPGRKKFLTEVLEAYAKRQLSFADVSKMDRNQMKKVAEQGFVKLKHGRYEEARKTFEILSFVDHKNYFHRLALGGAYQKLNKNIDAAFQYGECLKYDPDNTNALVNRGEIFLKHQNFKKAAEDFRSAIQIDKEGKDLFSNRARSLVIAIKRSIAAKKGESKATQIPISPSRRRKVSPLKLFSGKKPAKGKS